MGERAGASCHSALLWPCRCLPSPTPEGASLGFTAQQSLYTPLATLFVPRGAGHPKALPRRVHHTHSHHPTILPLKLKTACNTKSPFYLINSLFTLNLFKCTLSLHTHNQNRIPRTNSNCKKYTDVQQPVLCVPLKLPRRLGSTRLEPGLTPGPPTCCWVNGSVCERVFTAPKAGGVGTQRQRAEDTQHGRPDRKTP